jgi:hypothetical protein
MKIFNISNVHEFEKISFSKGTFEDIVLDEYFEESKSDEFDRVMVYSPFDMDDDRKFKSQEPELIKDVINRLEGMELQAYNKYENKYDVMFNGYAIDFFNSDTYENITIYFNDGSFENENDGSKSSENYTSKYAEYLAVEYDILIIRENKKKKIIHYDRERKLRLFKVTGNKINMDYQEMLLSTLVEDN